ncbi:cellulose biosynthesis cyclic di-GMP-binding regulatory protein BcsB [Burkholderiaceae bacterium DAT-1]|nr:cellulose biosynthesis cyclic di-GMP-binding regulatory protein BcsB [Burkholderiaceae bacterium DAT-1]
MTKVVMRVALLAMGVMAAAVPVTFKLEQLQPNPEPIRLRNAASEYALFIPMSAREQTKSMVLNLEATNSISLTKERSQLMVQLNGRAVAQVALSPLQPELHATVRIPVEWLKPGYNRLSFTVAQHYTIQYCEDPAAPELWTDINPTASTLTVDTELKPTSPRLSDLNDLFDAKQWTPRHYTVVTGRQPGENEVSWGALVTQGAALRLSYQGASIRHVAAASQADVAKIEGADLIVAGSRDDLVNLLPATIVGQIRDGYLGVFPHPGDNRHFMLVVSGTNPEQVTRAAQAFALMSFPVPDTVSMDVSAVHAPTLTPYAAKNYVRENSIYRFKQLNFKTTAVQGMYPAPISLEMNLPADLYADETANVEFHLHMSYGAALRKDSVLNVLVNGRFERAILLDEQDGAMFRDKVVKIPLRSFRPGPNTINFAASLMPMMTGQCIAVQSANLLLTMFDDSWVSLPNASHYGELPNLETTVRTGYPYAVLPDGRDVALYIAGRDSDTLSAAWMLAGKLAQRRGYPMLEALYTFNVPPKDRHVLVVGTTAAVDREFLKGAPIEFGDPTRSHHTTGVDQDAAATSWWSRLGDRFGMQDTSRPTVLSRIDGRTGLGDQILVMQYQSPQSSSQAVTALLASTPQTLRSGMVALSEPSRWDGMNGDVAVWKPGMENVLTQRMGPTFALGSINAPDMLMYWLSKHPWIGGICLLLVIGLFALLTRHLLRRFRKRYHAGVEEI